MNWALLLVMTQPPYFYKYLPFTLSLPKELFSISLMIEYRLNLSKGAGNFCGANLYA